MERITEATHGCFSAIIRLRAIDPLEPVSAEFQYQQLRVAIDQTLTDARELGFSEFDVVDIAYAMVALADEVALACGASVRELWMQRPLQLHYFNENVAGEGFFRRLTAVLADPNRLEILRVYYICLLLGFQGKYAIRGGELELDTIVTRVQRTLAHELTEQPLSVQPLRPASEPRQNHGFPVLWVAGFGLLFALGLLIALRIGLDGQTARLVQQMTPLAPLEPDR